MVFFRTMSQQVVRALQCSGLDYIDATLAKHRDTAGAYSNRHISQVRALWLELRDHRHAVYMQKCRTAQQKHEAAERQRKTEIFEGRSLRHFAIPV